MIDVMTGGETTAANVTTDAVRAHRITVPVAMRWIPTLQAETIEPRSAKRGTRVVIRDEMTVSGVATAVDTAAEIGIDGEAMMTVSAVETPSAAEGEVVDEVMIEATVTSLPSSAGRGRGARAHLPRSVSRRPT